MAIAMRDGRIIFWLVLVTILALAVTWTLPISAQQVGTTLSATKTATGHSTQTFGWSIAKSVSPDTWNLLPGQMGTSQYTIAVTKSAASAEDYVDGQICVTNGGSVPTANLQIMDVVQYKVGSGPFQDGEATAVDLNAKSVLAPGERYCYPYRVTFSVVAGATYRNVAQITITNHAGWLPGGQHCSGPSPCPFGPIPKADFSLPGNPDGLTNSTITVSDTNGGSWAFSDSGNVTYDETFTCNGDQGTHSNIATILETGQSASTSVQVNCDLPPDPGLD